jgi:hypothetical protein
MPFLQDNWEPALQALVTSIGKKFSAAFDRASSVYMVASSAYLHILGIGCAGEIRVRQDESYAQWAIDILVKFRDTEKLQLLTGQRQSGGVCTVFFLLQGQLAELYVYRNAH